ncbi:MOSC N-terminal beta barrel domain-containing protein [Mesorhizobium sp. 1M-11]|uniref:MOSC N-terminal beta barrel domain-containing protein n=1 Tax=Mesorhizobium sp. 1M-11 TaxID=1529006 RepID=UPI0006C75081|nr:MOSC N-terminal beta barrel domain-containing protein [Mesorhizobium sp. 1M-11]
MLDTSCRLERITFYPLKSGAGIPAETARLEAEGLTGDRRMMVVDETGDCLTARKAPRLMQIRTHVDGDEIVLAAPGMSPMVFSRGQLDVARNVSIWGDDVVALDAGEEVSQWLTRFLDRACRMAIKGTFTHRPLAIGPGGTVSFADTAPLLLTNFASLADINRYLDLEVEMERFRPNLVVSGASAFDEDGWRHVRIGDVEFEAIGACDRCVMTTLDPATGEARSDHEPLAMLGRQRRGEDGKAYFGQFLIPRTLGRLHVGDKVEVLSRKPAITILPGNAQPVMRLPSTTAGQGTAARQGSHERRLNCVAIIDEAADFRTFRFAADHAVDYKPGQFITLLLDIDGETVRRNYTISSSPSRPHYMSVTVKRVGDGRVSNWLHDTLKVGDSIRSLGPNGRFHLAAASGADKLLLLSAGSGITPMMAMLRFIADTNLPLDVCFHHSARGLDDVAFLNELLSIKTQMGDRLKLSWNLTGRDAVAQADVLAGRFEGGKYGVRVLAGRLDDAMMHAICPDLAGRAVLCCGPDGFRTKAREIYEGWSSTPEFPFLEETFGPDRSAMPLPEIGNYQVSFLKAGKSVSGSGTVTLLELARKIGVDLTSDCEAGICGSCRCKVVSGEWRVAANAADPERSVLSQSEKDEGYVLACSTSPIGDVCVEA